MIVATLNRTARAFALAVVGAEYVLRWLPRGTHRYDRQGSRKVVVRITDGDGRGLDAKVRSWAIVHR